MDYYIWVEHQLPKIGRLYVQQKCYNFVKQPILASTHLSRAYTTWLGGWRSLYAYTKISME